WYLQEVEGIRTDVQVVNLSLLNTGWYIRQLKKKMPEYIRYSEKQIDEYFDQHLMTSDGFMRRYWPEKKKLQLPSVSGSSIVEWELGPTMQVDIGGSKEGFIKIQDQMVLEIIAYNAQMDWKRPVYFAVTVGSANFIGLDEWMRMDGLCFRVVDYKADKGIDPEEVYERVLGRYLTAYRNLDDPGIYYDDNILRLLQNYRSAFMQLAIYFDDNEKDDTRPVRADLDLTKNYSYNEFKDFSLNDKKRYLLYKMEEIMPFRVIPYSNEMVVAEIAGMYSDIGEKDSGSDLLASVNTNMMTLKKQIRFIMYVTSRGLGTSVSGLLENVKTRVERLPDSKNKYEQYFELYAGFAKLEEKELLSSVSASALEKIDNIKDSQLQNSLFKEFAVLAYQGGDSEFSAKIMNRLLEKNPNDKEGIDLLYQIYYLSGNYLKALETADKYLTLNPDDEDYIQQKAELEKMLKKN
ncbi:MAG: hypothetical protein PHF33_05475, partial [Candidatus Delongbacteria bacterium]|nr:hypothetical protein [Candidatus Delongbacteria bacterium]